MDDEPTVRPLFEELDRRATAMGEISLRRRRELTLDLDVYEAKLDDEYLMSSLFPVAEIALADLGLGRLLGSSGQHGEADLDVVVGGLGLGYTAEAALRCDRIRALWVVEALEAVCGWHEQRLLPASAALLDDPRCSFVVGDFFALVAAEGFAPPVAPMVDAVLLDIDHSPDWHLHDSHAGFYEVAGLERLRRLIRPGGVFGLWSDAAPDPGFIDRLAEVFDDVAGEVVPFANPFTGGTSTNTVYLATVPAPAP